jgi:hypothetical protein
VTPLVKPVRPPRIFEEKEDTLFTTDAAKAEPGIVGIEILLPAEVESGGGAPPPKVVDAIGRATVGSYRHHQDGVGMSTGPLKVCLVRSSYLRSSIVQSMTSS